MEFEFAIFLKIILTGIKYILKFIWYIGYVFPFRLIKLIIKGLYGLASKRFVFTVVTILAVLVLGSFTAYHDMRLDGSMYTIVKENTEDEATGKSHEYAQKMSGLLRVPVFTLKLASPSAKVAHSAWKSFRTTNDTFEYILRLAFAFLGFTIYFLLYSALSGFIVIFIGIAADIVLHIVFKDSRHPEAAEFKSLLRDVNKNRKKQGLDEVTEEDINADIAEENARIQDENKELKDE